MEWPWLVLAALGASHGLNPAMGWLFAVALGMQEGSVRAVRRALLPLAVGHAVAILGAMALLAAVGTFLPLRALRWVVAGILFAFASVRLFRRGHPRYGGMRIRGRQLAVWSFLMASAHGAGLMVAPFVLPAVVDVPMVHVHGAAGASLAGAGMSIGGLTAAALHTAGYLAVTGALALIVYRKVGLGVLRRAWINVDLVWTALLFFTAAVTPFL